MDIILIYILPFLGLMGVLVAVHEGGHYLAARLLGIRVTDFAIGMGPTIWSRTDRTGCVWRLCALPIGGYVRMLGDGSAASSPGDDMAISDLTPEEREGVFRLRPPGHRAAVVAAGPLVNFVFGFLILWTLYAFHGHAATPPVAADVLAGSPAAEAGLSTGDRFLTIDGVRVDSFEDVIRLIGERAGRPTDLTVMRDGVEIAITVTPRPVEEDGFGSSLTVGRIGVTSGERVMAALGPLDAAVASMHDIVLMTAAIYEALWELVTLDRPIEDMGGPVKIAEISGDTLAKFGLVPFIALAAIISVNLGVMNLLPIPVLDGGHLVIYAVEAVRGRPAHPRTVARMFKGGAVALLIVFTVITAYDIVAIVSRVAAG